MDLISAAALLAKKAAEREAISRVTKAVVSRWSDYRAERFLDAFVDEVRKEQDVLRESANLNDYQDLIAKDEACSSALFDAYRRVCLSASKSIGPQIIGLLTAQLILQKRDADDDEELIFQAAEHLNDADLVAAKYFCNERIRPDLSQRSSDNGETSRINRILVHTMRDDMRFGSGGLSTPPLSVGTVLGVWSLKLLNLGLIWQETHDTASQFDRLNTVQGDPPRTTELYVFISPSLRRLAQLVDRANAVP